MVAQMPSDHLRAHLKGGAKSRDCWKCKSVLTTINVTFSPRGKWLFLEALRGVVGMSDLVAWEESNSRSRLLYDIDNAEAVFKGVAPEYDRYVC